MKKLFVLLLLLGFGLSVYSEGITTRMRPQDRFIIEPFIDLWQNVPSDIKSGSLDRGVSFNYLYDYPLGKSNFSIAAGLNYTSHNYYTDSHLFTRVGTTDVFDFVQITDGVKVDKVKISLNYIGVPVEIRYFFRTFPKALRIHAGFKTAYLVNGYNKYVGKDIEGNDYDVKFREYKLENIEKLIYGVTARIGYGRINVFGFMPLNSFFTGNSAKDMYPISLGLSLILF